jgi:hypothetical protein
MRVDPIAATNGIHGLRVYRSEDKKVEPITPTRSSKAVMSGEAKPGIQQIVIQDEVVLSPEALAAVQQNQKRAA